MKKYIYKQDPDGEEYFIDPKTGAIMSDEEKEKIIFVQTAEQREANRVAKKKEKFKNARPANDKGPFTWHTYHLLEKDFPNLRKESITKLMFLSTYMDYDGKLVIKGRPITKKQMPDLLRVSRPTAYDFIEESCKAGILKDCKTHFGMDKNLFFRGSLPDPKIGKLASKELYVIRLYARGIRKLYKACDPSIHKQLSYVFEMLPYVNRSYNIVCLNPLEDDLEQIECITFGQFCDSIGYSRTNASKLFKALRQVEFDVNGKKRPLVRFVVDGGGQEKQLDINDFTMFINPKIYYAGDRWDEVEILGKF